MPMTGDWEKVASAERRMEVTAVQPPVSSSIVPLRDSTESPHEISEVLDQNPFFESYLVTRMRGLVRGSTSPIWVAGTPD